MIVFGWVEKSRQSDSPGGKEITFVEVADLARVIGTAMMEEVEPRYYLSVDVKPKQNASES